MPPQPQPSRPGAAALAIASRMVGYKEAAEQNTGPICRWSVRLITPRTDPLAWCCGFVLTCYHFAGVNVRNLGRTLESEVLWRFAAARGWTWQENSPAVLTPSAGDIVFFATGQGHIVHCGLVRRLDLGAHDLETVEGNSRNAVRLVHRSASAPEIFGFARVPDGIQGAQPPLVLPDSPTPDPNNK